MKVLMHLFDSFAAVGMIYLHDTAQPHYHRCDLNHRNVAGVEAMNFGVMDPYAQYLTLVDSCHHIPHHSCFVHSVRRSSQTVVVVKVTEGNQQHGLASVTPFQIPHLSTSVEEVPMLHSSCSSSASVSRSVCDQASLGFPLFFVFVFVSPEWGIKVLAPKGG